MDYPGPPGHGTPRPPEPLLVPLPEADLRWLDHAILLGRRGWGRVHPNPMVGCVLVRDGRVVAEGWHGEFGGPHAEVGALESAGAGAAGATAYVSLEPCRHEGKTPACTAALERAGVARVVYAVADPSTDVAGGGDELRAARVPVDGPVWPEAAGRRENPSFFHGVRSARPYVALKLALSLDGALAEAPGRRTQISGPESAAVAHRLRAGFDAVLVGAQTVRADDPRLTVRAGGVTPRIAPARMVLDPRAELSAGAALFRDPGGRVMVFTRDDADEAAQERIERAGAEVHPVPSRGRRMDLGVVLERAAATGIRSVLCEGGGQLATSLLSEGRVDRMYLVHAPRALGRAGVPAFPGPFAAGAWEGWTLAFDPERLGVDVLTVYERA